MNTATKTKRKTGKAKAQPSAIGRIGPIAPPAPAEPIAGAEHLAAGRIRLECIAPHPGNPRQRFDSQELDQLAESIRQHDVLQPVLVRPHGEAGQYQLVCGERRWRAATIAGCTTIPCTVRILADAKALELMVCENEEREDLTPIELARGIESLCRPVEAGGAGWSRLEAARKFGHEEAWATDHMALLKLPEAWQQRIASGVLLRTYARSMLPYARSSAVMTWIEDLYFGDDAQEQLEEHSREDFEKSLDEAVHQATRPLDDRDKPYWDYQVGGREHGRLFKLTAEIEAELGVCELPVNRLRGRYNSQPDRKIFPRATNVARWEELQAEAKAEKIAKKKAREAKQGKGAGQAENAKAPTAAQAKAKREEQDGQLARRVEEWAEDLLRTALARELKLGQHDWLCRLFVGWWQRCQSGEYGNTRYGHSRQYALAQLRATHAQDWPELVQFAARDEDPIGNQDSLDREEAMLILRPAAERRYDIEREVVWSLAGIVHVKLVDEWRTCHGEPLRTFFGSHTREQLVDLAVELGADVFCAGTKKGELMSLLADQHESKPYKTPAVLAQAAPVKRGRKPK